MYDRCSAHRIRSTFVELSKLVILILLFVLFILDALVAQTYNLTLSHGKSAIEFDLPFAVQEATHNDGNAH